MNNIRLTSAGNRPDRALHYNYILGGSRYYALGNVWSLEVHQKAGGFVGTNLTIIMRNHIALTIRNTLMEMYEENKLGR